MNFGAFLLPRRVPFSTPRGIYKGLLFLSDLEKLAALILGRGDPTFRSSGLSFSARREGTDERYFGAVEVLSGVIISRLRRGHGGARGASIDVRQEVLYVAKWSDST